MEHLIKMDDLGVPLFSETSMWCSKGISGETNSPDFEQIEVLEIMEILLVSGRAPKKTNPR